jgi:transposase-like protein
VQDTLNALLDAEADRLCGARRYEHSPERVDTRAGHYERQVYTKAGEVTLKMPKLRSLPFETATWGAKRYMDMSRLREVTGRGAFVAHDRWLG